MESKTDHMPYTSCTVCKAECLRVDESKVMFYIVTDDINAVKALHDIFLLNGDNNSARSLKWALEDAGKPERTDLPF